jgi:hypothetical protein
MSTLRAMSTLRIGDLVIAETYGRIRGKFLVEKFIIDSCNRKLMALLENGETYHLTGENGNFYNNNRAFWCRKVGS